MIFIWNFIVLPLIDTHNSYAVITELDIMLYM